MSRHIPRLARTLIAGAVAVALAALGIVATSSAPAQAAITPGTWYRITSAHSNLALDITGAATEPGAELIQWNDTGATNQQFRFIDAGGGYYQIQVRHSGHVLDVLGDSTANGATVIQGADVNAADQQWSVTEHSDGTYGFINRNSGKALDVWEWSTDPGDRISQYDSTGGANQQWNLTQVDGGSSGLEVTIDYGADAGPAEHVASGFLHGIDPSDPAQYLIDGIDVHSIRGADYHPNLPSLYDQATYQRVTATGAEKQVGLYYYVANPDHPNNSYWPGDGGDFDTWRQIVTDVYQEAQQRNLEVDSWITWNEPNLQWNSPQRPFSRYLQAHDVAYDTVKDLNPNARVQAPELSLFDFGRLTQFLSYCRDNGCLPDVLAWHELTSSPTDVPGHAAQIRQWMIDNGITPMPMTVTEYQGTGYGNPNAWHTGKNVRWLAQFERAVEYGMDSALYSAWEWVGSDDRFRASLGNAADRATVSLPRGVWWNYHAYGDMTGRMVETTSTWPTTVDALAAVDTGLHRSVALIGNQTSEAQNVTLELQDLPAALVRNGQAHVRVESMANAETLTNPGTEFEQNVTVSGGDATLELTVPAGGALRADVIPALDSASTARWEAEDLPATATSGVTYRTFAEAGASGGEATALEATANGHSVAYTVEVPGSGVYNLRAGLKNLESRGMAQIYVDGQPVGGPFDEYGSLQYYNQHADVVELSAGAHEIEFRVVGANPASGSRWYVIDYIELISLGS